MMTFAMMSAMGRAKKKYEVFFSVNPKESLKIGLNRVSLIQKVKPVMARLINKNTKI